MDNQSTTSNDSIERIDFGGRFARQFFQNWFTNLSTSTPVASDNSICDSGYDSFNPVTSSTPASNTTVLSALNGSLANDSCTIVSPPPHQSRSPLQHQTNSTSLQQHSSTAFSSATSINNLSTNDTPATLSLTSCQSSAATINALLQESTPADNNANRDDDLAKLTSGINLLFPDIVARPQRSNSLFTSPSSTTANCLTATSQQAKSALNPWATQDFLKGLNSIDTIERAALMHRSAASYSEPQYTWSGQLPSRSYKNPVYSCKVFLGGVPWDVTEQGLIETFGKYGPVRVQWPPKEREARDKKSRENRDYRDSRDNRDYRDSRERRDLREYRDMDKDEDDETKAGYVYLIYESDRSVKSLLQACTQEYGAGSYPEKYYYKISSRRMRYKDVQIVPWIIADSNYIRCQTHKPDMNKTVFVGALHGMLTAEGLAKIMNDLFGGVAYVGIDSDKYRYPLGSGRVTFINQRSYNKAVAAAFIEVKSAQFCKIIQVDPYMNISQCSTCHVQSGPVYCRDCLRYFCRACWNWNHPNEPFMGKQHHPMMRKKRDG